MRSKDPSGVRVLAVAHPVEGTSWVFAITIDQKEVYELQAYTNRKLSQRMKDQRLKKSTRKHIYVFASGVLLIILLGGAGFYRKKVKRYREGLYNELELTARYQSKQIRLWYQDELKDASVLAYNPVFVEFASAITLHGQEPLNMDLVTDHLLANKRIYEKESVAIIDQEGNILASSGDGDVPVYPHTLLHIRQAIEKNMALTTDIYSSSAGGSQYLDVIAPIADAAEQSAAVLLIRLDPGKHLFPVFEQDIGRAEKMESILVSCQLDIVCFTLYIAGKNDGKIQGYTNKRRA